MTPRTAIAARVAVFAACVGLALWQAEPFIVQMIELVRWTVRILLPAYALHGPTLELHDTEWMLSMRALALADARLPRGTVITVITPAGALLAQAIVITGCLTLWPMRNAKQRLIACVLVVPFGAMALMLDTPFVLAGALEDLVATTHTDPQVPGWPVLWMHAMNGGGRYALALAAALGALIGARWSPPSAAPQTPESRTMSRS